MRSEGRISGAVPVFRSCLLDRHRAAVGSGFAVTDRSQSAVLDNRRIALALAGNAQDGAGDDFGEWGVSIYQAKINQCGLVGRRHRLDFFWPKGAVGNQPIDSHGMKASWLRFYPIKKQVPDFGNVI
jgi:hypothetical protein